MAQGFEWSFGDEGSGTRPPLGRETPSPLPWAGGRVFADRYLIEAKLGEGGMGVVFRARDAQLGRPVALKVLNRTLNEAQRARFAREGELNASLLHPDVVRVFGGGVHEGRPFLVLELVEGAQTLEEAFLARTLIERGELLVRVARAVAAAHEQGIVHRDLKFENVLVNGTGQPKVCDFGLAWRADVERLTRTGAMIGTPMFMAPEQTGLTDAIGTSPGPASDVWALGVMLYFALGGELPFRGGSLLEVLQAVLLRDPFPLPRAAPRQLESVCRRALSKHPEARFPNAGAFADALEAALPTQGRSRRLALPLCAGLAALALVASLVWAGEPDPASGALPSPSASSPAPTSASLSPSPSLAPGAQGSESAAGARGQDWRTPELETLLASAHEPTEFQPSISAEFERLQALAAGDAEAVRQLEIERLGYLYRRGRWPEVIDEVSPLLEDPGPLGARALLLRALAGLELGRDAPALRTAARDACLARWERASRGAPGPLELTIRAWAAFLDRDYTSALDFGERALRQAPELLEAILVAGLSEGALGRLEESEALLLRARALESDHPTVWEGLIALASQRSRTDEALRASQRLLSLIAPRLPRHSVTFHFGQLNNLARHAEARALLEQALAQDPGDTQWTLLLGYSRLVEGKRPRFARSLLREAYQRQPKVVEDLCQEAFPPTLAARLSKVYRGSSELTPGGEAFKQAEEALLAGEEPEGLRLLRQAAQAKVPEAQYALASSLEQGKIVPPDPVEAVRLYRLAAEAGYGLAMNNLAHCYIEGSGTPVDLAAGVRWYRRAIAAGEPRAQLSLGVLYAAGQGVPRDQAEALRLWRAAAKAGQAGAMLNLGRSYATGDGVPVDRAEALRWFELAAQDPKSRPEALRQLESLRGDSPGDEPR